jgi:hypothetical protein
MSFSRISTLALALAAGLAAPSSAGIVSGTFELSVTSSGDGQVTGAFRDAPSTPVSGSGVAAAFDSFSFQLTDFPVAFSSPPLVLSRDEFSATTLPNVNGNAGFTINRAFTLQNTEGVISFSGVAGLNLLSYGASDFGAFDAILSVFELVDGLEVALEPTNGTSASASFAIADGASQSNTFGLELGSFSLNANGIYFARLSITGSTTTFAGGDPEPSVIPLPATAALLPLGLVALGAFRRRKTG